MTVGLCGIDAEQTRRPGINKRMFKLRSLQKTEPSRQLSAFFPGTVDFTSRFYTILLSPLFIGCLEMVLDDIFQINKLCLGVAEIW